MKSGESLCNVDFLKRQISKKRLNLNICVFPLKSDCALDTNTDESLHSQCMANGINRIIKLWILRLFIYLMPLLYACTQMSLPQSLIPIFFGVKKRHSIHYRLTLDFPIVKLCDVRYCREFFGGDLAIKGAFIAFLKIMKNY